MNNRKPLVSIIIPCRNEEKYIGKCLDSIIASDYPKHELEVLVIDGMSEDGTRNSVSDYAKKYSYVKLITNSKIITSCALNKGINNAKGNLILWMSAHNEYEKNYISRCVKYLEQYNADAVGGIIKTIPRNATLFGKLSCIVLSHPFGVGNSIHKIGSKSSQWADTAFGVCYKKEIFSKVGTFNENLVRGQDMELNLRLKKAGLRLLLVPEIVSYYYSRSDFLSFLKHNFKNGKWAILPFKYSTIIPVSWRHLVPLAFVASIIIFMLLSILFKFFFLPFLVIIGLYSLCNIYFSTKISIKESNLTYLFIMPIVFSALHLSYGLGALLGVLNVNVSKRFWSNLRLILRKR